MAQPGSLTSSNMTQTGFWTRYSPHGEFPLSSAASLAAHLFIVLIMIVGILPRLVRDREPPSVDVIRIAATADTPAGLEPVAAEESAEAQAQLVPSPAESMRQSPREELKSPRSQPIPEAEGQRSAQAREQMIQEVRQSGQQASQLADRMRREREQAQARLNENIRSATPAGAAGADAGARRSARLARWVLGLAGNTLDERLLVLDRLGAEVAFPLGQGRWRIYAHLTGAVQSRATDLSDEARLYWGPSEETLEDVRALGTRLGVPDNSNMLMFLPAPVEAELADKEKRFANREEDEIASTRFAARAAGSGYQVEVVTQVAKEP